MKKTKRRFRRREKKGLYVRTCLAVSSSGFIRFLEEADLSEILFYFNFLPWIYICVQLLGSGCFLFSCKRRAKDLHLVPPWQDESEKEIKLT